MKTLTTALGILVVTLCHAADFPLAGGDIASDGADGWNGAKPGSGQEAKFTQAGTYTASGNVTFGYVNFATDGLVFDLTSDDRTVTLDSYVNIGDSDTSPVVGPKAANATTELKGGAWTGSGMTFKGIGDGYTLRLSDGASITDAGTLSLGHSLRSNSIVLTGGSEIHANTILFHRWGGTNAKLDVGGGSKVYSTGAFMVQQNGSVNFAGYHLVDVHDAGSLLQVGADLNLGQWNSDNIVRIRDGATLSVESTKVRMAGGGSHLLEVLNGATATVKTIEIASTGNRVFVSNATCTASTNIQLGNAATVTGNVMRVEGQTAVFNCPGNVFGLGCGNLFELVDGATWDIGGTDIMLMSGASSNVLRVAGGAVLANTNAPAAAARLYIGSQDTALGYNRIEILDGAMVNLEGCLIRGVNNAVVVSNATLRIDGTGYGIWLGHGSNSSGNKLIVQGTTPSVYVKEYKSSHGSTIRFEIPAEGYAEGYVPMTMMLDSALNTATERFEIDCAAWVANPDAVRKLVLMRTTTDITSAQADWILAQNADLPESVRLKVTSREVIIQKRGGFILSFR